MQSTNQRSRITTALMLLAIATTCRARDLSLTREPDEFGVLKGQLDSSKQWDRQRLLREALRPDACLLETDRNPLDVIWRRTHALLADLQAMASPPDLQHEASALEDLRPAVLALQCQETTDDASQRELFLAIAKLRRQIAFKNPLLDFERIVFLKHNPQVRGERHMVDQYLGFNQDQAGGVYVLEHPFSGQPSVTSLLASTPVCTGRLAGRTLVDHGSFIGLDLDYDAHTLLFAFTEAEHTIPPNASFADQHITAAELATLKGRDHYFFRPESTFHIFKAATDGSGLSQLTDGIWDDYDPCFLPNGRIAFISERAGGNERCGVRPLPSATLHAMMPDGHDIIQLSWHDTNEWQPSVDHSGMLVYTRWDYVDRDSDVAHHLWLCSPDGRDPRSLHGNYPHQRESRPWMEMSVRAIPGSSKYLATAAPHHGNAYGSLVQIDLSIQDDRRTSQIRRLTPEARFPEAEITPGVPFPRDKSLADQTTAAPKRLPPAEIFGSAWPLSEDYSLCVYDPDGRHYGIYLIDSFGNRELLYRDAKLSCLDPIPLKPRPRPPLIPSATTQAQAERVDRAAELATATVAVMNVYESELPMPKGVKIKELRVVNIFPKDNTFLDVPHIGHADQALARGVLGTVPVEDDGSVYFKMPTGAGVYFQLLDSRGLAIQTMRSDTYLHPGERMTCIGCHEDKHTALTVPPLSGLAAFKRPPSELKPEVPGSYPLSYPRLVQPVLDAKCVACHDKDPKRANLHGDITSKSGWSKSFESLRKFAWGMSGGNGIMIKNRELQYSIPGKVGAQASLLYPMLAKGHHAVQLTPEELRRLTLWLDCNSNFFGAYDHTAEQAAGQVVRPRTGIPAWTDFEKLLR
ncbi:MAG: hypothetical protein WCP35_13920 [Verrucomicrobiota bacterium]